VTAYPGCPGKRPLNGCSRRFGDCLLVPGRLHVVTFCVLVSVCIVLHLVMNLIVHAVFDVRKNPKLVCNGCYRWKL